MAHFLQLRSTHRVRGWPCAIREVDNGVLCGYLLLSEAHPWHGATVHDLTHVEAHKRVSWAADAGNGSWAVGFACGHADDLLPGTLTPRPDRGEGYVLEQLQRLVRQAEEAESCQKINT